MGLFSLGSSVLPSSYGSLGSMNLNGQFSYPSTPTATSAPKSSTPVAYAPTPIASPTQTYQPGGLRAGPAIPIPRAPAPAPAAPVAPSTPAAAGGTSTYYGGGASRVGAGGGGGGGSFSFSNTFQGPSLAPIASPDFSGLLSGFGNLLSQSQQNDIPESLSPSTQKDTMQLQGLREASAGWSEITGQGGANPALGQRIPPDESKKLAALQQARIY